MEPGKKIKILNVLTNIEDGGLEMLVYRVYNGLDKNKYDVNLCSLMPSPDTFIMKDFGKVCSNIYTLDFKNKNIGFYGFFKNLIELIKLLKIIQRNRYDIVHSHDFFAAFYTRFGVAICKLSFRKYPQKVFSTYHNLYYWLKPVHRVINKFLSFVTDKIVCVSKSVMEDSIAKEHIKKNKYAVIYNGINCDEFYRDDNIKAEQKLKYGYEQDDFIVGNVGVISVRKGQIYLLKAFNKLSGIYPKLKLVIVGSTRNYEMDIYNEIVNYIKDNNLDQKVKILDTVRNVNRMYNMIDVFVMCSITEGFGLSAYEAMLTEKICIFSDIPVFKELTDQGKVGYIFENKNSDSLFEVLKDVVNNYDGLQEQRKIAREYVLKNFDYSDMVRKYDLLYSMN